LEFVEEWGWGLKPKDHPWLGWGGVVVRLFSGTTQSGYAGMYVVVQFYPWFNFYFLLVLYSLSYIYIKKNKGK